MIKYLVSALAFSMLVLVAMSPSGVLATGSGGNPPGGGPGQTTYQTLVVYEPVGTFPATLDPANCYDTASAECIFNSYETLLFFLGEQNLMFTPMLATQITVGPPHDSTLYPANSGLPTPVYTNFTVYFKIRGVNPVTGAGTVPFHNRCRTDVTPLPTWAFYYLNTTDVEYSLERVMVHDYVGGAAWTLYEPLLDAHTSDLSDPGWGALIDGAVESNLTHVWINCANPALTPAAGAVSFTPVDMFVTDDGTFDPRFYENCAYKPLDYPVRMLMQTLSQSWCSIISIQWVCTYVNAALPGIGGTWPADWNGTFGTPAGGWQNYTKWAPDQSPLDKLPLGAATPGIMCGTGPYILDTYAVNSGWDSVANDLYYGGFPAKRWSPPYPSYDPTIVPSGIMPAGYVTKMSVRQAPTLTRISSLVTGACDVADIPRHKAYLLHKDGDTKAETVQGIRLNYPLFTLQVESLHYTFLVDNPGGANTYGNIYPNDTLSADGIPANFFTNEHVRKAMTYLVNFTYHIQTLYDGEAYQPYTCAPNGLPYVNAGLPKYGPNANLAAAKAELDLATFGDLALNTVGFTVPICYCDCPSGVREASCQNLAAMIWMLGGTYGLPYYASTYSVDWPTFMKGIDAHLFAVFRTGWLADYADVHDFLFCYADSQGTYATAQRFSNPLIDIDLAGATRVPDGPARQAFYYDAEARLYDDNPSVFIYVPMGRGYQRDWVQGFGVEYNALYPGVYAYYLWKWNYLRGNVDYNKFVNMGDLNYILDAFGSYVGKSGMPVVHTRWNFHCDIDGCPKNAWNGTDTVLDGGWRDRKIDMYDVTACLDNIFKTEPGPGLWVPPTLSVSISPASLPGILALGTTQTFTSSGIDTGSWSYQWFLDGGVVPNANSPSWQFTPTSAGQYSIYLVVTDFLSGKTATSNTVQATVADLSVSQLFRGFFSNVTFNDFHLWPRSPQDICSIQQNFFVAFHSSAQGWYNRWVQLWYEVANDDSGNMYIRRGWTIETQTPDGTWYYTHNYVDPDWISIGLPEKWFVLESTIVSDKMSFIWSCSSSSGTLHMQVFKNGGDVGGGTAESWPTDIDIMYLDNSTLNYQPGMNCKKTPDSIKNFVELVMVGNDSAWPCEFSTGTNGKVVNSRQLLALPDGSVSRWYAYWPDKVVATDQTESDGRAENLYWTSPPSLVEVFQYSGGSTDSGVSYP